MESNTLICKRCKAPLEYEEGSAVLHCPHCGYTEKIDENDPVTIARIRAKTYKETELGKSKIEKETRLEEKKLDIEEKSIGIKKAKYIFFAVLALVLAVLVGWGIYSIGHLGKIHLKQSCDDYIGKDYQYTHNLLSEAGFTNIVDSEQKTLSKKEQALVGKVIQVSIDGNTEFKAGWYAKGAKITIYYGALNPAREKDIRMPMSRTDCIGKDYQAIKEQLEAEGFNNIKIVAHPDLSKDRQAEDGKITRIAINDSEEFYLGDYFAADSIIQIDYQTINPERATDVMIPANYDSYTEKDYLTVCQDFREAGFTNITLLPQYDVRFYEGSKDGIIESVSVNGDSTFLKGTYLPKDTEVKITYRTKDLKYVGEDYQEISDMLSEIGFLSITLAPMNDLGVKEVKKSGEVVSVLIDDTELSEATELNLLSEITIQYHSEQQAADDQVKITTSSKDFSGENYEDVIADLKEMGFTNVKSAPLNDLKKGWPSLHSEGDVKEVAIGDVTKFSAGELFDKDDEVLVSYHSFQE